MDFRIEKDSMGDVKVPSNKLWGAQTQRSLSNFKIGAEKMPLQLVYSMAKLKEGCAIANNKLGLLDDARVLAIKTSAKEIYSGNLDEHFPLVVWQTGSGTQTNMNLNEVIANFGNAFLKESGYDETLHPNDHVNMSQSSNDTFPTAMHMSVFFEITNKLIPAINSLEKTFEHLEKKYDGIMKIGRTHLQDATPLKFSDEISAFRFMLINSKDMILKSLEDIKKLAIGGTAVGSGINAPNGFDVAVCDALNDVLKCDFSPSLNKFHSLTSKDAIVFSHGAIKSLATNLMKIANDIRFLASGPRCGFGEISIPENEPGSSIMPGKVNPTQCEALTMACIQVMANDVAITSSASLGNFQLNVFMPVIIYNFMQSVKLMSEAIISFNDNCAVGITVNHDKMDYFLQNSLMLVTALNPYIGYDNAAKTAKLAFNENISLRDAVIKLDLMDGNKFDEIMKDTLRKE